MAGHLPDQNGDPIIMRSAKMLPTKCGSIFTLLYRAADDNTVTVLLANSNLSIAVVVDRSPDRTPLGSDDATSVAFDA